VFITEYYKKLFGAPIQNSVSLSHDENSDIPQVSSEENVMLTSDFTEEEVFEAISQMEHNKAPGLDGFRAEFYKTFWNTIKGDLMAMFVHLQQGVFPLYKLNFGGDYWATEERECGADSTI
jgi:mannosylglycoprotein endo-beta-mannosidase